MHHRPASRRARRIPLLIAAAVACGTLALAGCQEAPAKPAVVAGGGVTQGAHGAVAGGKAGAAGRAATGQAATGPGTTGRSAAGQREIGAVAAAADGKVGDIFDARIAPGVRVTAGLNYGTAHDPAQTLDVCTPPASAAASAGGPLPAVIAIHGGSWVKGDKASRPWRMVCRWLASSGFVTYSIDYRLGPQGVFPAAFDDVERAVRWVREPANAKRFGIDPARVGVLGGSAGGNLAALLGMHGHGSTTTGSRVAAVVDLSGPVDLTEHGLSLGHPVPYVGDIERAFLDCASLARCPDARRASAVFQVDPSDPPVFIAHSSHDLIRAEQGEEFSAALARAHVRHSLTIVPGSLHATELLDAPMREDIVTFLHRRLG